MSIYDTSYTKPNSVFGFKKEKALCPQCGRRSFNLQTLNGKIIDERVGSCDHANKCGYIYRAADYFRKNPGLRIKTEQTPYTPPPQKPPSFMDSLLPDAYRSNASGFVNYLLKVFPIDRVIKVADDYKLGANKYGNVIFWQIDMQSRCRSGKVVSYKSDGHRGEYMTWMHSVLKLESFNLSQVLFGEHLLTQDTKSPICLVESAKSAVIGSIVQPELIWLSTEGASNWNIDKLLPLRQRHVVVIPDLWKEPPTGKKDWHLLVNMLRSMDVDAHYWDKLEQIATPEQREKGWDIADFLLETFNNDQLSRYNQIHCE